MSCRQFEGETLEGKIIIATVGTTWFAGGEEPSPAFLLPPVLLSLPHMQLTHYLFRCHLVFRDKAGACARSWAPWMMSRRKRQQGTCDWCRNRPLQMKTCQHHLRDLLAAAAEGGMRAGQRAVIGGLPAKLLRAAFKTTRCLESNLRSVRKRAACFPYGPLLPVAPRVGTLPVARFGEILVAPPTESQPGM